MALSPNKVQVKWSTSNSVSVSAGGTQTSDEVLVSETSVSRELMIKVDNGGTPAPGDTIEIRLLMNAGDPDADPDSADEFGTSGNADVLAVLDTNAEDPVIYGPVPVPFGESFKVHATSNAASNSITVSAQMYEQLSA